MEGFDVVWAVDKSDGALSVRKSTDEHTEGVGAVDKSDGALSV